MRKFLSLLFFILIGLNSAHSANFLSKASAVWSSAATWSITAGTDADGIPDADDNVTINGQSVNCTTTASFRTLNITVTGTLVTGTAQLFAYGNINLQGTLNGNPVITYWSNATFNTNAPYTRTGDWYIRGGNLTIPVGVTIARNSNLIISNGVSLINNGAVSTKSISLSTSGTFVNGPGAALTLSANITGTGTLSATGTGNTVTYNSNAITSVYRGSYYNLILNGTSGKLVTNTGSPMVVLNDFILNAGGFNLNGNAMSVGGNWSNNANITIVNQGLISFNGSGTQTINKTGSGETFKNLSITGTGTTLLNCDISVLQDLTVSSGTLDVGASNFNVTVKGNLVTNSTINCRANTFTFDGTTAQTIGGTAITPFFNVTLNNTAGITINSGQTLSNALTVTTGNFNANAKFVLLSDASTTARIAPVGTGGSFSGTMVIRKFISARAEGWHDLSSPVQSTTINDWDNEMYMSGIGVYDGVVGPAGVDGETALDFKSVYTYAEPTAKFVEVTGSSTALTVGKGYEIWFADDQNSWYAKTIDTRGTPNFGTIQINCSFAGPGSAKGYNLIGNPYASAITFSACTRTRINANILFLDGSGNVTSYGSNATIPAHQGFWVIANGSGARLTVTEAAKSTDVTTGHYRKIEDYGIKLVFSSPMSPFYNENTINFEPNTTKGFDNDLDAPYIKSPVRSAPAMFMINTENDGQMITNAISGEEEEVILPLGYYTPHEGTYYIQPNILNPAGYNYIWIENTKTGERHDLGTNSMAVPGKEDAVNTDYVLHLSKTAKASVQTQTAFANDLTVFNIENSVNIKANHADHLLSQVSIYDLSGKLITEQSNVGVIAGNTISIDISSLAKGMYIVNVTDQSGNRISKKIVR
jgi:hypothetical protein